MSERHYTSRREVTDEVLHSMADEQLTALMEACAAEPAEPDTCDACAAYVWYCEGGDTETVTSDADYIRATKILQNETGCSEDKAFYAIAALREAGLMP